MVDSLNNINVLLVEDDKQHATIVQQTLEKDDADWRVTWVQSLKQARFILEHRPPDVVLMDLYLADGIGVSLLPEMAGGFAFPFIILSGQGDEEAAVEAIKSGAMDYIPKSEHTLRSLGHVLRRTLRDWNLSVEAEIKENELRALQEKYQGIFESAPVGLAVMTHDGRITEANEKAVEIFSKPGHRRQDGTFIPEPATFMDRDGAVIPPAELASAVVMRTGEAVTDMVIGVQRSDQPLRWVRYSAFPLETGSAAVAFVAVDITEQVRVEDELRDSEQRFRDVAFAAGEYFWEVDAQGKYTYVTDRIETILERSKSEIHNKTPFDFMPPDEAKRVQGEFQQYAEAGAPFRNLEHRSMLPDGRELWQRVAGEPLFDSDGNVTGYRGTAQDITELKEARHELDQQRERLLAILEGAELGLWDWNVKTGETVFDERWARMLGYELDEVEQNVDTWARFVHPEDLDFVTKLLQKHLKGEVPVYVAEHRVRHKNGDWLWIMDTGKVLERDAKGEPVRMAGIHMDITPRKRTEEQLRQARLEAETADQMKSQFLANMSHEIRTPMNAILGFTDILQQEARDDTQREYLSIISTSANTLLRLIDDILDLSKIEAGKMELQTSIFDPRVLAGDITQLFKLRSQEKGLTFEMAVDEEVPEALYADEIRIRQILLNLIGNAFKFTQSGSIKASLTSRPCPENDSAVELTLAVEDTGLGIPKDQLEEIFSAFVQQKGQRHSELGGTGLGLTITRRLAELMQGEISVSSKVGAGSRFEVRIPRVPMGATAEICETNLHYTADEIEFQPAKVLVVDDSPFNRSLARAYLNRLNLTCLEAANGREAIEAAKKHKPDLVLLDMVMPVLDGYETMKVFSAHEELSKIPVVALTASAMKGAAEKTREAGCKGYIQKPASFDDFLAELPRHLAFEAVTDKQKPGEVTQPVTESVNGATLAVAEVNWAGLDDLLDAELLKSWEHARDTLFVDEIKEFADRVLDIARQHGHKPLRQWAELLHQQAVQFTVQRLPGTLAEFEVIRDAVKRSGEDE